METEERERERAIKRLLVLYRMQYRKLVGDSRRNKRVRKHLIDRKCFIPAGARLVPACC